MNLPSPSLAPRGLPARPGAALPALTFPHIVGSRTNDDVAVLAMDWDIEAGSTALGVKYQLARQDQVEDPMDPRAWEEVTFYRYVRLLELTQLPLEEREDPDVLGKVQAILRGIYNAGVDMVYMAVGLYDPDRIGVVQVYGAAAEAWDPESARRMAHEGGDLVQSNMHSAFPYSRFTKVSLSLGQKIMRQVTSLDEVCTMLGYPDPRKSKKGMGRANDGGLGHSDDELASQQGEYLLRALGHLRRNFVFLVTAAAIRKPLLSQGLTNVARVASEYASRQKGGVNFGMSVGMPWIAGMSMGVSEGMGASMGESQNFGESWNEGWNQGGNSGWNAGVNESTSFSVNDGFSENIGTSDGISYGESTGYSQGISYGESQGASEGISYGESQGVSDGISYGESQGVSDGISYGESQGVSDGISYGESQGFSEGVSWGTSQGYSEGLSAGASVSLGESFGENTGLNNGQSWGESWGENTSIGTNQGINQSANTGFSDSTGSSWSDTGTESVGEGTSRNRGQQMGSDIGLGAPIRATLTGNVSNGWANNISTGLSVAGTEGGSQQFGLSEGRSTGDSSGTNWGAGVNSGFNEGGNVGESWGQNYGSNVGVSENTGRNYSENMGWNQGVNQGTNVGYNQGVNVGTNQGWNQGTNQGTNQGWNQGTNQGTNQGWNQGYNQGTNVGTNQGVNESFNTGQNRGWNAGRSSGLSHSFGQSMSRTTGQSMGVSGGNSWGDSWGASQSLGASHNIGRNINTGRNQGSNISTGLSPGLSVGRSWQTEDDVSIRLTEIYRGLETIWARMTVSGGFVTTTMLLTDRQTLRAGMGALQQSFHGPDTPMPVVVLHINSISQEESMRIRNLGQAFLPSVECHNPDEDATGSRFSPRYSAILDTSMLAAYMAPNMFEDGRTITVQQKPPPTAVYPAMPGEVRLGYFFSAEDGLLTDIPVHLERSRHFHTLVAGDTGFGKTVAMERLVYETTLHWHMRSIVFDFGAGWRKMLNAPGLDGRVDVRMLGAGSRPLRWNPLQVSRRIACEDHWRRFCETFAAVSGMGASRQLPEMRTMLYDVYVRAGVLVEDRKVYQRQTQLTPTLGYPGDEVLQGQAHKEALLYSNANDGWYKVRNKLESMLCGRDVDTLLEELTTEERQILGRHRSGQVDVNDLLQACKQRLEGLDERLQGYLQGISSRLETMTQGRNAELYAKGDDVPDICEIVPAEGGICVLEGGAQMDSVTKAFLLGWAGWQIFQDAVNERVDRATNEEAHLQLVFEEANKIFTPGGGSQHEDAVQGQSTSEQWESMWRDSRKYGIYLHCVSQNPSQLPQGIVSSSNNAIISQLKNAKDVDAMLSHFHRSQKGFRDEEWRRYVSSIPRAETVCKLAYSFDRADLEPFRMRPLMLDCAEPTNDEIVEIIARHAREKQQQQLATAGPPAAVAN